MRIEPEKVQRDKVVPAEIPGIEIKTNYEAVLGPAIELEVEKEPMGVRRLALTARANDGLSVVNTSLATTRGVDKHGVSDDVPVFDLTGYDPLLLEKTKNRVKKEMVNDGNNDSSNEGNDDIPPLQHQNKGDNSGNDNNNNKDE